MLLIDTRNEYALVFSDDPHVTSEVKNEVVRIDGESVEIPCCIPKQDCTATKDATVFFVRPLNIFEFAELEEKRKGIDRNDQMAIIKHNRDVLRLCCTRMILNGKEICGGQDIVGILETNGIEGKMAISTLARYVWQGSVRPYEFFRAHPTG